MTASFLAQGSALVRKNTILLLRARVTALMLVLSPPLFVGILGFVDISLNTPPAIVNSTTPFLTLNDAEPLECHVFGSSRSGYGLGMPIPDAWCAPMLYSPSSNEQVRSVVQTLAERRSWTASELSGGDLVSSEMPAACAARACVLGFSTSKDLTTWLAFNLGRAATAVVFKTLDGNNSLVDLTGSELPDSITVEIWYNESAHPFYGSNGFDKLAGANNPSQLQFAAQHAVEEAILATKVSPDARSSVSLRRYPRVPRKDLIDSVRLFSGIFFYLPLMLPMMYTLNLMVAEKEFGMLSVMRQLGLRESLWWGSFLLQAATLLVLSACSMYAVGTLMDIVFFSMADFAVVIPTFWLFGMASVGSGCVLAAVISRSRVLNLATSVLLAFGLTAIVIAGQFESYFSLLFDPTIMPGGRTIINLIQIVFPLLAFVKAHLDIALVTKRVPQVDASSKLTVFVKGERYMLDDLTAGNYTGTQSSFKATADTPPNLRTFVLPPTIEALGWMALCVLLYVLLAAYLSQARPGGHGRGEPWYFPLLPRYWLPSSFVHGNPALQASLKEASASRDFAALDVDVAAEARRVLDGSTPADRKVVLLDLKKRFDTLTAVDGVSLSLAEGEVFALLGHNGAGKSTIINLCTCSLAPTSGDALVYGCSVNHDTSAVRALMGICPQHDVLFEKLTALEHLRLFGRFKGVPSAALERDIPIVLEAVKLMDVRNKTAGTYSGGMKRRLSCAIAYIGEPKFVVLDEPTTGMDPYNRKFAWSMIETRRANRTTLLTTHSMEEADALGQEIAIMSRGQLVALGSSMRLKRRFGAGYSIKLVTPSASAPALRAKVHALLPSATLVDDSAGALTFAVGEEAMEEAGPLLRYIERLHDASSSSSSAPTAALVGVDALSALGSRFAAGCAGLVPAMARRTGAQLSADSAGALGGDSGGGGSVVLNDWLITRTTLEEVFIRLARAEEKADGSQGDKMTHTTAESARRRNFGACCGKASAAAAESPPAAEHAALDVDDLSAAYALGDGANAAPTGRPRALRATWRKNSTLLGRQRGTLACVLGLPLVVIVVGAVVQAVLDREQAKSDMETARIRQHLIDSCAKVTDLFDNACKKGESLRVNGVCNFCATPTANFEYLDFCCERKLDGPDSRPKLCTSIYQRSFGRGGGEQVGAHDVNQCVVMDGNENWEWPDPPNFNADCAMRNYSETDGFDFYDQDLSSDDWTQFDSVPAYCNCTDESGKRSIALQERIDATPICFAYSTLVLGRLMVQDVRWVPSVLRPGALDEELSSDFLGWRVPTFAAPSLDFGKLAGKDDTPYISRSDTLLWKSSTFMASTFMASPAFARKGREDDFMLRDDQEARIVEIESEVSKSGLARHFPYTLGSTGFSLRDGQPTVPCTVSKATTRCCYTIVAQDGAVPEEVCNDDGSCPRLPTIDSSAEVSKLYIIGIGTLDADGRPASCVGGEPPICIDVRTYNEDISANATCASLFGDRDAFSGAVRNWTQPYDWDSDAFEDEHLWQCIEARCVQYESFVVPSYAPAGFADQAALDQHVLDQQNLVRASAYVDGADGVDVADGSRTRLSIAEYLFPSWALDVAELQASKGIASWTMTSFFARDSDYFYASEPVDPSSANTYRWRTERPLALRSSSSSALQSIPLMLQNAFSNAMLRTKLGEDAGIRIGLRPMPTESALGSDGYNDYVLDFLIQIAVPFATSILLPTFVNSVVEEKQLKLRSLMMMMGLPASSYWFVEWSFDALIAHTSLTLFWALGAAVGLRYFKRSVGALFFIFQVWAQLQVAISVLLSCAFNRTRTASIVTYMLVMISAACGFILWFFSLLSLAPPWNPAYDAYPLFAYYHCIFLASQKAITIRALFDPSEPVCLAFWLMVAHTAWLLALGLYLDAILPREFGLPSHPLFCAGWFRKRAGTGANGPPPSAKLNREHVPEDEDADVAAERAAVEGARYARDTPISCYSLRKVYADGKVAINNLTFAIHNDECFGLLGPNGAGKSTTISVLTGLFRPSSGTATIGGHDILTNMPDIYRRMAVCPQFDILWPQLTVREHMLFYCRLKGVAPNQERAAAEAAAGAVRLGFKLDKRVSTLSGGQKRRVSLGISLIGNPAVVFLDEPTTGLDPETKRLMWQLIERSKAGRVIVLTTHSMDEADALCSRIGIMANGELRCLGSNVHLKKAFSDGFKLDVAHESDAKDAAHAFMMALLPTAEVISSFATSKTYAVRRAKTSIAAIFDQMSKRPLSAGIIDWGLRQTSLEEVFLKVAREAMNEDRTSGAKR